MESQHVASIINLIHK